MTLIHIPASHVFICLLIQETKNPFVMSSLLVNLRYLTSPTVVGVQKRLSACSPRQEMGLSEVRRSVNFHGCVWTSNFELLINMRSMWHSTLFLTFFLLLLDQSLLSHLSLLACLAKNIRITQCYLFKNYNTLLAVSRQGSPVSNPWVDLSVFTTATSSSEQNWFSDNSIRSISISHVDWSKFQRQHGLYCFLALRTENGQ